PLHVRVVGEEVVRRGLHAVQVDVVEPVAEGRGAVADLVAGQVAHRGTSLRLRNLAPQSSATSTLSEPGLISMRSCWSREKPSTWAAMALITSAWLTAAMRPSGW